LSKDAQEGVFFSLGQSCGLARTQLTIGFDERSTLKNPRRTQKQWGLMKAAPEEALVFLDILDRSLIKQPRCFRTVPNAAVVQGGTFHLRLQIFLKLPEPGVLLSSEIWVSGQILARYPRYIPACDLANKGLYDFTGAVLARAGYAHRHGTQDSVYRTGFLAVALSAGFVKSVTEILYLTDFPFRKSSFPYTESQAAWWCESASGKTRLGSKYLLLTPQVSGVG
jgi:hypothetical protein